MYLLLLFTAVYYAGAQMLCTPNTRSDLDDFDFSVTGVSKQNGRKILHGDKADMLCGSQANYDGAKIMKECSDFCNSGHSGKSIPIVLGDPTYGFSLKDINSVCLNPDGIVKDDGMNRQALCATKATALEDIEKAIGQFLGYWKILDFRLLQLGTVLVEQVKDAQKEMKTDRFVEMTEKAEVDEKVLELEYIYKTLLKTGKRRLTTNKLAAYNVEQDILRLSETAESLWRVVDSKVKTFREWTTECSGFVPRDKEYFKNVCRQGGGGCMTNTVGCCCAVAPMTATFSRRNLDSRSTTNTGSRMPSKADVLKQAGAADLLVDVNKPAADRKLLMGCVAETKETLGSADPNIVDPQWTNLKIEYGKYSKHLCEGEDYAGVVTPKITTDAMFDKCAAFCGDGSVPIVAATQTFGLPLSDINKICLGNRLLNNNTALHGSCANNHVALSDVEKHVSAFLKQLRSLKESKMELGKTIDSKIKDLTKELASEITQRTMKKADDKPTALKEIYSRVVFDNTDHSEKLGRDAAKLSTLAEAMQTSLSRNIAKVLDFFAKCNTYLPKDEVYLLDMCIVTGSKCLKEGSKHHATCCCGVNPLLQNSGAFASSGVTNSGPTKKAICASLADPTASSACNVADQTSNDNVNQIIVDMQQYPASAVALKFLMDKYTPLPHTDKYTPLPNDNHPAKVFSSASSMYSASACVVAVLTVSLACLV